MFSHYVPTTVSQYTLTSINTQQRKIINRNQKITDLQTMFHAKTNLTNNPPFKKIAYRMLAQKVNILLCFVQSKSAQLKNSVHAVFNPKLLSSHYIQQL